jgi:3-oxoacyl-[acyl-carrier-protein] synthase II
MEIYIQAASAISPQETIGQQSFLAERDFFMGRRTGHTGNRLTVIEPDYGSLIDPKSIRRMSRIIRMGVGAAVACLRDAKVARPDAIVTGTAYGCLADTGIFLSRMIEQQEDMLPPTAFIQSTHNTVGGQIALLLQCHGYNNTFVHRGHSFESALLDAILLLQEDTAVRNGTEKPGEKKAAAPENSKEPSGQERTAAIANVLVGGIDEITDSSHAILSRFGLYKHAQAGEGAAFFLLSGQSTTDTYAKLKGLATFYKPKDGKEIEDRVHSFLNSLSVSLDDIDLVIMGDNGDPVGDKIYEQLASSIFNGRAVIGYKDLCGEYPTSTSFALWFAANIVQMGAVPADRFKKYKAGLRTGHVKSVLVYNHYQGIYHSLLLITES